MPSKCPVCQKNQAGENHHGLCFECYKSLNTWALNKCKEFGYTKTQTGIALMVILLIGEWLKEQRNA